MKKTSFLLCSLVLSSQTFSMNEERFSQLFSAHEDSLPQIPTPRQPQGPFYPVTIPIERDADLTEKNGQAALGQYLYIGGVITDTANHPIKGAKVEIWQACASGKYNHEKDLSEEPIDPNFQYYGVVISNDRGEYRFKTILPGAYKADKDWWRPPHIHFYVSALGYKTLVTQSYFDPASFTGEISLKIEDYNNNDLILQRISKEEQQKLIVSYDQERNGVFNICLER